MRARDGGLRREGGSMRRLRFAVAALLSLAPLSQGEGEEWDWTRQRRGFARAQLPAGGRCLPASIGQARPPHPPPPPPPPPPHRPSTSKQAAITQQVDRQYIYNRLSSRGGRGRAHTHRKTADGSAGQEKHENTRGADRDEYITRKKHSQTINSETKKNSYE